MTRADEVAETLMARADPLTITEIAGSTEVCKRAADAPMAIEAPYAVAAGESFFITGTARAIAEKAYDVEYTIKAKRGSLSEAYPITDVAAAT